MSQTGPIKETKLEYWFTIFALFAMTGGLLPLFGEQRLAMDSDVNPMRMVTTTLIFLTASAIAIYRKGVTLRLLAQSPLIIVLFMLPVVSMIWAVDPDVTFRRSTAHLLTGCFCVYIAGRMSPEEFLRRLTLTFFIGGVASLLYVAAGMGIHQIGALTGAWKGIYGQKNELGRIASLAVILAVFMTPLTRVQRGIRAATIVIFLFLVVMCQSRTNWFTLTAMLAFIPLAGFLRNKRISAGLRIGVVLLAVAGLVLMVGVGGDAVLAASGRDMTFSGRQTLWRGVNAIVGEKYPILGAGYGGFFTEKGESYELKAYLMHWPGVPNHAHNGVFNTRADTGIPGLLALALFVLGLGHRLVRRIMTDTGRKVWSAFGAVLVLFLINNFSESVAYRHSDVAWILVVIAYLYAADPFRAARGVPAYRNGPRFTQQPVVGQGQ